MRLLLDTHVAIWAVIASERLSTQWMSTIADPDNDVAVSVASLWELGIKNNRPHGTGMGLSVQAAIDEFAAAQFQLIAIDGRHTIEIERLPLHHRDPFDRLLVVQAMVDGYRLVTHDRALAAYGSHVLLV